MWAGSPCSRAAWANLVDMVWQALGVLRQVKSDLKIRARSLRNATRTNAMLGLMVMSRRGLGDERAYTRLLHAHLESAHGATQPLRVGVVGGPRLH